MKKVLISLLLAFIMCSCASYKLEKTVWSAASVTNDEGKKSTIITNLYFRSTEDVDIYSAVVVDTSIVVTPYKYAECKYRVSGNPRKEAKVDITGSDLQKQSVSYKGVYHKTDAMILISQDSIPYLFGIQNKVKIK